MHYDNRVRSGGRVTTRIGTDHTHKKKISDSVVLQKTSWSTPGLQKASSPYIFEHRHRHRT